MTEAEIGVLFEQSLIEDDEEEHSRAREAIAALHADANRAIFGKAAAWCKSDSSLLRARGAIILGQLRQKPEIEAEISSPVWLFRDEALNAVSEMLEKEE